MIYNGFSGFCIAFLKLFFLSRNFTTSIASIALAKDILRILMIYSGFNGFNNFYCFFIIFSNAEASQAKQVNNGFNGFIFPLQKLHKMEHKPNIHQP